MTKLVRRILQHEPTNLIGGETAPIEGDALRSHQPAHPDETVWQGSPRVEDVARAVEAAREAQGEWARTPLDTRIKALRLFQSLAHGRVDDIAQLICAETGKAMWDSKAEASLLASKVEVTLDKGPHTGMSRVTGYEAPVTQSRVGVCQFRPHGVMAVLGPFNFPAHLPNGHIVPALAMGNTIVFKPSDKTPAVGQLLAELFCEALEETGAPAGTFNLVQGGADVATELVDHPDLNGILFTGSWPVGRKILEANLDRPGRIVALELGGNNPSIVMPDADLKQAAIEVAKAAFVTTGQRCTCTRRLIVHEEIAERFIPLLTKVASTLVVGDPMEGVAGQQPFMGPIIRNEARQGVLEFQGKAAKSGARVLLESTAMDHPSGGHYITPGIVEVDRFSLAERVEDDAGCDHEVFGPLLRVATCSSLDDAIEQANATRYGLASAIFTQDRNNIERFLFEAKAGCVNVNNGTAGASGKLPFGGLGLSGNHRPAGAFSLDYCAYPVASLVERETKAAPPTGMQFDDEWLK